VAPALNNYEYQFGDTGTLLNQNNAYTTADLPFVDITKVSGLDSGEFRTSSHDHEGVDGGYLDSEFQAMRTIVLEGTVYADVNDPETICDALKYDFRPVKDPIPFYFKYPSKPTRMVFGKGQGAKYDLETLRRTGQSAIQLQLIAETPYIYDVDAVSGTGNLGVVDPGIGFNMAFDMSFGGLSVPANGIPLMNNGNHEAWPVVLIGGQIDQPFLVDSVTGNVIKFNISLGINDILTIDMFKHTVHLNDVTNRRNTIIGRPNWFSVPRDMQTTIFLFGASSSSTGSITATSDSADNVTIVGTDADASDVSIGQTGRLFSAGGVAKELTVFTVTGKSSVAGFTTIAFSPGAGANPVTGDVLRLGGAVFSASLYNTWY
jgi:hypothetical protein